MIRIPSLFLTLLLIGVIGCDPASPLGSQRFKVVGMAEVYSVPPPNYAFVCCNLNEIALRDESLVRAIDIDTGDLIETEKIVQLSAREIRSGVFFDYGVLMGPNPGSSDSVLGWFENSDTTMALHSPGWVYVEGQNTRAKSDWVSAATRGSAIVLQIVTSSLQRVFFLEGLQLTVTCNQTNTTSTLSTPLTYIDVTDTGSGCGFSAPILISATPDAQDFINYVTAAATACGLPY